MNTFSVKVDHQLNASNLHQRARLLRTELISRRPPGNSGEIVPPNGPVDMFNSVTDPTAVALAGVVWNSTLSNRTLLETRFGIQLLSRRRSSRTTRSIPRASASTPGRSMPPTSACPA